MRSNTQRLQKELQDNETIELCARQCGLIGDITKLKICYLLRYHPELSVTTIAELVNTSVSNTSHSLSKLRAVNLVKTRKEAQTVFYSLNQAGFSSELKELLNV
ncbi:winged helix-turn-helix transcriptional regulator [Candidatus Saccharibacteria bacterium]|nr:winged helix-turn-helix transcriptional regulator [Candidatus Saccharibacteria bacterium]